MGTDLFAYEATQVVKPQLGTKRIDPETGRKFYDLNKDPVVSPYTGTSYPRSYFESGDPIVEEEPEEEKELDAETETVEVVSLEEADEEAKADDEVPAELADDEEVDLGDDDEDTFLEAEEEEEEDVGDIVNVNDEDD
jgi:uncharacterized protein (TIGR02300 family)